MQFAQGPNHTLDDGTEVFWPSKRDPQTLALSVGDPRHTGTRAPHRRHREAGRHGQHLLHHLANHDFMVRTRQAKIDGIDVPDIEVDDPSGEANTLVLGWGSTYGPITAAVRRLRAAGKNIAQAHLRHINPFPRNPRRGAGALRRRRRSPR